MPPSCLELNSDDFLFLETSLARLEPEIAFLGVVIKNRQSSSALIKRNENSDSHPLSARAPDGEEKTNTKTHKYKDKYKVKYKVKYNVRCWPMTDT